ncbi:MAG TPA: hypothetical protein VJB87_04800 [Candidatus Nanoarchaeia archaeon]|nr:hypothetical protein [Candidatus Nanoarchaeia archaeon]
MLIGEKMRRKTLYTSVLVGIVAAVAGHVIIRDIKKIKNQPALPTPNYINIVEGSAVNYGKRKLYCDLDGDKTTVEEYVEGETADWRFLDSRPFRLVVRPNLAENLKSRLGFIYKLPDSNKIPEMSMEEQEQRDKEYQEFQQFMQRP